MRFQLKVLGFVALGLVLVGCGCCKKSTPGLLEKDSTCYDSRRPGGDYFSYLDEETAGRPAVVDRVFFGFDRSDIDDESQNTLLAQAKWLKENPGFGILISGHCDERGTREYNIGLGARRANSAKSFLVMHGIESHRIRVVSKGKDDPIVPGSNEEAWAQNRVAITSRI